MPRGGVNRLTSIFPENSSQRLKLVGTSGVVSELPGVRNFWYRGGTSDPTERIKTKLNAEVNLPILLESKGKVRC